jgi:hypothetical protein
MPLLMFNLCDGKQNPAKLKYTAKLRYTSKIKLGISSK